MGWASGLAVYFILWWLCLFVVLPFGIEEEQGEKDPGHQPGAPVTPSLKKKALYTTILSLIVWLVFYCLVTFEVIDLQAFAVGAPVSE
jgi:predicted secreted protein